MSAPPAVRRLLLDLLEESDGPDAYEVLCAYLQTVPDEFYGNDRAHQARYLVNKLDWWQVYDLIEQHANWWTDAERVNNVFAEAGIGFEFADGTIGLYEPEAEELEVAGVEDEPLTVPDPGGRFRDAKEQYKKGLDFQRQRPPDLENAVSNAVNAVEGAVTVITGEKTLSAGLKKLYAGNRTPLRKSIEQLHNTGSSVPGVRHGAHAPSGLNEHEALYIIRAAGSALAYLIAADYEGLFDS